MIGDHLAAFIRSHGGIPALLAFGKALVEIGVTLGEKRLTEAEKRWDAEMAPFKGRKVITYHRSWPNFCERFGLQVVDYVEPKPGIPPTPSHTLEVINTMKRDNIKLVMVEPYFDLRTPNSIAQATGATVVVVMPSVGGVKEITDYFKLFDYDINLLVNAFNKVK